MYDLKTVLKGEGWHWPIELGAIRLFFSIAVDHFYP